MERFIFLNQINNIFNILRGYIDYKLNVAYRFLIIIIIVGIKNNIVYKDTNIKITNIYNFDLIIL